MSNESWKDQLLLALQTETEVGKAGETIVPDLDKQI